MSRTVSVQNGCRVGDVRAGLRVLSSCCGQARIRPVIFEGGEPRIQLPPSDNKCLFRASRRPLRRRRGLFQAARRPPKARRRHHCPANYLRPARRANPTTAATQAAGTDRLRFGLRIPGSHAGGPCRIPGKPACECCHRPRHRFRPRRTGPAGELALFACGDFAGRSLLATDAVSNFAPPGFNDRAASAASRRGTWSCARMRTFAAAA